MPLGIKLLLLFTIVPVTELFFLLTLARNVGYFPTVTLILFSGIIGAMMIRFQGLRTWLAARGDMAQGKFPADALIDGLLLLIGGALLITPGLLTDFAGFSTLIPPIRAIYRGRIKRFFAPRLKHGGTASAGGFKVFTFGGGRPPQPPQSPEQETQQPIPDERPKRKPFEEKSPFDRLNRDE